MNEQSSRREFLRTLSLAGATVAIAGVAGCEQKKEMTDVGELTIDKEGFVVVKDPALIKQLDTEYHSQMRHGKTQKNDALGFKLTFVVTDPTGPDCPGNHTVNSLCGC